MIQICAFKKREKEGGEGRSQLGGPWKVPSLVTNEETSCLVANGKFQCLVTFGRKRRSIIFTSFHFILQQILLKPFFSIDFKVLLYNGFRLLLFAFLSFSLTYKLEPHILMYQVFHTFIVKLILIKDFFFSLNSWHCA
jgi:hypothetical protein